jgi:hypothetical protein
VTTSRQATSETALKPKHNRRTAKVLNILNNIESRIQRCLRLSLHACSLDDVGRELSLLRTAMENVSGGVGVVIERKKAIATQIDDLTAQFGSHQDMLHGPIEINTGKSQVCRSWLLAYSSIDALQQASVDRSDEISQIVLFLCVACRVVMGVSRSSCDLIIKIISVVLFLAFRRSDGSLSSSHENILKQIPLTSDGAEAKFHLTGKTIAYAVCSCHCTYPPTYAPGSTTARYPERCIHCPMPGTECGDTLLVGPEGARRPKKTFMYHDFKDYLSGLLSHRDVEAVMDEACDNLMDSINSPLPPFVKNPFEAQFLRSFGSPKPETLFINRGEEGRYAFALHVDFFNPEGMNVRGASTSCRIISMACLNLPLDIRYKPENMYLAGIIPGPKQPSLENLNHYIRPLMNDLVDAWERGIKFSKTACYPNGRLTCCAVALVVCDLPAARHFYCSACDCYHKSTYGRVDFENWTPRDRDKLRAYAEQWRDAATSAECEALFKAHGVRYSELWHLPYWDPSRQLVIDLMHCLLEGLVPHHTHNLLGLTSKSTASASTPLAFLYDFGEVPSGTMTTKEMTQVSTIQALLLSQMIIPDEEACFNKLKDSLFHKNIRLLKYICNNLGLYATENW